MAPKRNEIEGFINCPCGDRLCIFRSSRKHERKRNMNRKKNVVDHASFQKTEDLLKDNSALTSCSFEKVEVVEYLTSDLSSCHLREYCRPGKRILTVCTFKKLQASI